jgi:BirA family biotin operon repressor/biotin-[acetyl-CoA-carboxylase] ligase
VEQPPQRIEVERCGSTQDELRRLAAAGAPAFTSVRADEQTAGRGRRGRSWIAPPGSALLASILLRPERAVAEAGALSLVAGVAVCDAVQAIGADARLRWPNDVVVGGRKLAGVLPELVLDGGRPAVLVGIGVNLSAGRDELPSDGRIEPTSLALEGIRPPHPRALLDLVTAALRRLVASWEEAGLAPLSERLAGLDDLAGRAVTLELADGRTVEGTTDGIDPDGALRVLAGGGLERHRAGEVVRVR